MVAPMKSKVGCCAVLRDLRAARDTAIEEYQRYSRSVFFKGRVVSAKIPGETVSCVILGTEPDGIALRVCARTLTHPPSAFLVALEHCTFDGLVYFEKGVVVFAQLPGPPVPATDPIHDTMFEFGTFPCPACQSTLPKNPVHPFAPMRFDVGVRYTCMCGYTCSVRRASS